MHFVLYSTNGSGELLRLLEKLEQDFEELNVDADTSNWSQSHQAGDVFTGS